MSKKKTIFVEIESKQLDALEDLLTVELSPKAEIIAKKHSFKLWQNLVSAYDDESNDLENQNPVSHLALYNALEVILKYDECFVAPKQKELKVQDIDRYNKKIKLIPENVVAIISNPDLPKQRNKSIYVKEETKRGLQIRNYFLNSNDFNFNTLREYLDPLNHYLLNVSKNAIINVDCYEISKKNLLTLNLNELKIDSINTIQASNDKPYNTKINFPVIKNNIKRKLYLQKFIIGYKNDFNL